MAVMSAFNFNPLLFAYKQQGILKYQNLEVSGELFVIKDVLPELLCADDTQIIMFDVGANVGKYTQSLLEYFHNAVIYSFEPNPNAFDKLSVFKDEPRVKIFNVGFNDKKGETEIFTYADDHASSHASIYEKVISSVQKSNDVDSVSITLTELDLFCEENDIRQIDFLKIDTEGNEFKVLEGAKRLLDRDVIKAIQFEFNEMNVISRVFFKDFFDLLGSKYNLYRLDSDRLIPIPKYNSVYEIFKFQNILALQKRIDIRN
jgi:FkbM family methyltransferase